MSSAARVIAALCAGTTVAFSLAAAGMDVPFVSALGLEPLQLAAVACAGVAVFATLGSIISHSRDQQHVLVMPMAGYEYPAYKFQPAYGQAAAARPSTAMHAEGASRRDMLNSMAVAGAAGLFPQMARADGAASAATQTRARGIYGSRIAALKGAVDKGDALAVLAEKNAFTLYNSGAFSTNPTKKREADAYTKAIFDAVEVRDNAALKKAYSEYVAAYNITGLTETKLSSGQGISSEFDFKYKTPAGTIYQR